MTLGAEGTKPRNPCIERKGKCDRGNASPSISHCELPRGRRSNLTDTREDCARPAMVQRVARPPQGFAGLGPTGRRIAKVGADAARSEMPRGLVLLLENRSMRAQSNRPGRMFRAPPST